MADARHILDNPNGRLAIYRHLPGPTFEVFHWSRSEDSGASFGHFPSRRDAVRFACRFAADEGIGLPCADLVDLAAWRAARD